IKGHKLIEKYLHAARSDNRDFAQLQKQPTDELVFLQQGEDVRIGIIFGEKENGDKYSSKDLELIFLSTQTLMLALRGAMRHKKIIELSNDLSNKVRAQKEELFTKNKQVELSISGKDDALFTVAHQLKTPLTIIKTYLSL